MVIDAEIPTGSLFEWSLIDASTGTPLPNYQEMNDLTVDLGAIDWEETPSLRLKIHMVTGSNGGPKVIALESVVRFMKALVKIQQLMIGLFLE